MRAKMSTVVMDSLINNNINIVKPIISLKSRVFVPAASSIDWTELRRTVGTHKGRIEYHLIVDLNYIRAGISLNEKIAGLGFPDSTGRLDFNRGFRSNNLIFCKWCEDLFALHWNKKGKKCRYSIVEKL